MKEHLMKFNRSWIYHFTDKRNISLIKEHGGLMPRSMLERISFIPGGNEQSINMDNNCGMQIFVHLCFLDNHPMEYLARKEGRIDSKWLKISTCILDLPSVQYCAGVSNQIGATYLTASEAIKEMDLEVLFSKNYIQNWQQRRQEAEKYEILIPTKIPLEYIGGL